MQEFWRQSVRFYVVAMFVREDQFVIAITTWLVVYSTRCTFFLCLCTWRISTQFVQQQLNIPQFYSLAVPAIIKLQLIYSRYNVTSLMSNEVSLVLRLIWITTVCAQFCVKRRTRTSSYQLLQERIVWLLTMAVLTSLQFETHLILQCSLLSFLTKFRRRLYNSKNIFGKSTILMLLCGDLELSWGLAAQGRARDFTLNIVAGSYFIVHTEKTIHNLVPRNT